MREYLAILMPLLRGEQVSCRARRSPSAAPCRCPPSPARSSSPRSPRACWRWPVRGRRHHHLDDRSRDARRHIVPSITKPRPTARGSPRRVVVPSLPVMVSDDPDEAPGDGGRDLRHLRPAASYKAMLDREGAGGPADVAIVGDEDAVRAGINRMADAGCTDFVAAEFARSDDDRRRTRELLRSML